MTVKKSAGTKKTAAAAHHATPRNASVPDATTPNDTAQIAPRKTEPMKVWALPVAMLMLVVAAAGLWIAVRESSNTSQAATPVMTAADTKLAPEGKAKPAAPTATDASKDAAKPATSESKVVSITGCLAQADRGFVLKDTEGTDAPRSRSWKSGFMKRSNSSIALSDPKNPTRLAEHIGERVSVTGPLTDRTMRVTSLKRVASTCQ